MRSPAVPLLLAPLSILLSCQPEQDIDHLPVDDPEAMTFWTVPADEVVERSTAFLARAGLLTQATKSASSSEPLEPTEGMWVMEAASNQLVNQHMGNDPDTVLSDKMIIPNTMVNGEVKMSDAAMVAEFQALHARLATEEAQHGLTTSITDMRVDKVSLAETEIEVRFHAKGGSRAPLGCGSDGAAFIDQWLEDNRICDPGVSPCHVANVVDLLDDQSYPGYVNNFNSPITSTGLPLVWSGGDDFFFDGVDGAVLVTYRDGYRDLAEPLPRRDLHAPLRQPGEQRSGVHLCL